MKLEPKIAPMFPIIQPIIEKAIALSFVGYCSATMAVTNFKAVPQHNKAMYKYIARSGILTKAAPTPARPHTVKITPRNTEKEVFVLI